MKKRLSAVFLVAMLFLCSIYTVFAEGAAQPSIDSSGTDLEIRGKAAILMELSTGKILYAKNEHEPLEPASITKVMTMTLVLERIGQGTLQFEDIVTTSANAKSMGGSEIYLDTGEQMSVYDLMMATAVASANDAAVALGEHLSGGSEEAFAEMMNAKAKELGMNETHFVNACGLHEDGHITSAYDIALMSRHFIQLPEAQTFTKQDIYPIREGVREYKMRNSNALVRTYEGCIGIKTGFTNEAGYCLSAGATRDGETFIGVILGASSSAERNEDMAKLLDYGFAHFETYEIPVEQVIVEPIPVVLGLKDKVEVVVPDLIVPNQVIAKGAVPEVDMKVTLDENVKAPFEAGHKVGTIEVIMDGALVQSFDLTTKEEVGKRTFWKAFAILLKKIISM